MRLKILSIFMLAMVLILALTVVAFAKGNTPAQLTQAGWTCMNVPGLGVHCIGPGAFKSLSTVPVKVFDTADPGASDAPFLGTELLINDDIFNGQPCPQSEHGEYDFLPAAATGFPADYWACHHYDVTH